MLTHTRQHHPDYCLFKINENKQHWGFVAFFRIVTPLIYISYAPVCLNKFAIKTSAYKNNLI